jgi:hypothetical protein
MQASSSDERWRNRLKLLALEHTRTADRLDTLIARTGTKFPQNVSCSVSRRAAAVRRVDDEAAPVTSAR